MDGPSAAGSAISRSVEPSRAVTVASQTLIFSNFQPGRLHARGPKSRKSNGNQVFFNPGSYLSGGAYAFSVALETSMEMGTSICRGESVFAKQLQ